MKKIKKYFEYNILELALRIWAASYVIIYGAGKLVQFNGANQLNITIKDASNAQLMWAFFGATLIYPAIIGCLQITGGILLILNKTKILGAFLLTPIFLNIILLDILYDIHKGALINAVLFQSVFFLVFINQRNKIKQAFQYLINTENRALSIQKNIPKIFILVSLLILLFFLHQLVI